METKKAIDILNNLIVDDRLDTDERAAISDSYNYMRTLELKKGDEYDFQGWKVKKITMKQLRKFVRDNGSLDDDVNILVLEDDGMGGVPRLESHPVRPLRSPVHLPGRQQDTRS